MKLHVIARGKMPRGPESEIVARYTKRLSWRFAITELPDTGGTPPPALSPFVTVALDERGEQMSSVALAKRLETWRDHGTRECRFLIGAADGLTVAERDTADLLVSFGAATWPHMLIRAMLIEQLYRATSIIAGHPYHREG